MGLRFIRLAGGVDEACERLVGLDQATVSISVGSRIVVAAGFPESTAASAMFQGLSFGNQVYL
jgi:hypothetical protein